MENAYSMFKWNQLVNTNFRINILLSVWKTAVKFTEEKHSMNCIWLGKIPCVVHFYATGLISIKIISACEKSNILFTLKIINADNIIYIIWSSSLVCLYLSRRSNMLADFNDCIL